MLIATTTTNNILSQLGLISSNIFGSFSAYLYFFGGLFIAFWIIKKLISLIPNNTDKKTLEMIYRGNAMRKVIEKYTK